MNVDYIEQIEELSRKRHEAWAAGDPDHVVPALTKQIADVYAERRRTAVEEVHGPPGAIIKRARIESELTRLMSD